MRLFNVVFVGKRGLGRIYFASIRLAIALVCVGASLIIGGQWFGLLPNPRAAEVAARQELSEVLAINAAAHVRRQQWIDLQTTIQKQVDRNEQLLSVGLRSDLGRLWASTEHHESFWDAMETAPDEMDVIKVPITLNRRAWGNVELCFQKRQSSITSFLLEHPLPRILAFFVLMGIPIYTVFVSRVIKLFQQTQLVPERVRQALDTLAEGLLLLDGNERIVLANRAFSQTISITPEKLTNRAASSLGWLFPEGQESQGYPWMRAIHHSETQVERMLRLETEDGETRIFSVNAAPIGGAGSPKGALATFRDVTHVEQHRAELETMLSMLRSSRDEIERKNSELQILATQDALTGCLNRREFFNQFDALWKDAEANGTPLACIMIDNDHFKSVNDNYGHHIGDEVLRRVSRVIRLRHEDGLVCRYGGEEFCVVLSGKTISEAIQEAELTRIAISRIELENPSELRLTASFGVSELSLGAQEPQDMINQADACLYVAKRNGRNCVVRFEEGMEMEAETEVGSNTRSAPRLDIPYQAVTALVSALSYRDTKTAEHSRRVADLCVRTARGLLSKRDSYILEIAALLHDIGKVGVPDNILLKPEKLTDEEWEIMARHERVGVEIVAGAFNCPQLSTIVANRHAFFDGSGRHSHLPTGANIPLASRVLSIADSYDSMVSDRAYRKGRSHESAIEELRQCSGTQFDPELVEHFINTVTDRPDESENEMRNQAAIQIGFQVERIADAIQNEDSEGMQTLVERLGRYARNCEIAPIAEAAERIRERTDTDQIEWISLLREAYQLLDICRTTQSHFLRETLELDSSAANNQDAE